MRSLSTTCLLALTSLVPLAPLPTGKAEGAKKAPEALQGEWRITRSGAKGEIRELLEKHSKVVVKGAKVTVLAAADVNKEVKLAEFTVKLAPGKKPKEIDLKIEYVIPVAGVESEAKGKTVKGIYSLEGDTLKLYTDDDGKARPKKFPPRGDNGIITLKRLKKAK
jgi:uncharacterized protein (TIGR03067 family)